MKKRKTRLLSCGTLLLLIASMTARAIDIEPFVQQAAPNLVGYLQVDTINPPGNESRGVAYLGNLLDQAGIPYESVESASSIY